MSDLVERLRSRSGAIAVAVTDEMYRNPFWMERFGSRGRQHAEQDAHYHLSYVIQAIDARDEAVMQRYAHWLRDVLTTRGMCTRHLDESFARVSAALARDVPDSEPAQRYLDAARRALGYDPGPARELVDATERLAAATTATLYGRHPTWPGRERCLDDVRYHLSYVADGVALGRPLHFAEYVRFIRLFLDRRMAEPGALVETLAILDAELERDASLSTEAKRLAREAIAAT